MMNESSSYLGYVHLLWLSGSVGFILQLICVVHCLRHRKDYYWLFVIFLFSLPGVLIYFFVEWYPMLRRTGLSLPGLTPGQDLPSRRDIKRMEEELAYSDTVARRIKLASAYQAHGDYQKGLEMLKASCTGVYKDDPTVLYPLAQLYFHTGDFISALEQLNMIKAVGCRDYQRERVLLEAKAQEKLGNTAKAIDLYRSIEHLYPGEEVRCRLALLLLQSGDRDGARTRFKEITFNATRATWAYRRREKDWLRIAAQKLKEP